MSHRVDNGHLGHVAHVLARLLQGAEGRYKAPQLHAGFQVPTSAGRHFNNTTFILALSSAICTWIASLSLYYEFDNRDEEAVNAAKGGLE